MKAMYILRSKTMGSVTRSRRGRLKFLVMSSRKSTSISSCLACIPQFKVRRRSSLAFWTSTIGGYVSSRNKRLRPRARKPIKAAKYSVHRHPRFLFMTVKPPMKGASRGPVNTVIEKTVTARPRVRLLNISENTAATTARGQDPKPPPKNRQIRTVCRSFPTALPIENMEKPNMEMINGSFLPFSSDSGAHKIGPQANPRT